MWVKKIKRSGSVGRLWDLFSWGEGSPRDLCPPCFMPCMLGGVTGKGEAPFPGHLWLLLQSVIINSTIKRQTLS